MAFVNGLSTVGECVHLEVPRGPRVARGGSFGQYKTMGAARGAKPAAVGVFFCHTLTMAFAVNSL